MAVAQRTIRDAILGVYEALPPGERRLADTILAKTNNLASYSATELAREARISKATATRLFQRIGREGFQDVRRQARREAHLASPLYALAGVDGREHAASTLSRHMANDLHNLSQTFESLDVKQVSRAVSLLTRARHVRVIGFRAGHMLAQYARYLLAQLRDGVELSPTSAVTLAEDLASLDRRDVLLVIDFRRRVVLLEKAVEAARSSGAIVIFISGSGAPAISRVGDVTLTCHHQGASIFDSYAAPLSLIGYLATAVAQGLGQACRTRLGRIEALHDALGDVTG